MELLSQGTCWSALASLTPMRTRLNTSSSFSPGSVIARSRYWVYRPLAPAPSAAVLPGAVA